MRRSLTTLAALAATLVLLAGCGSDDDTEAGDDPTSSATTSTEPTVPDSDPAATETAPVEPTTTTEPDPTGVPTEPIEPVAADRVDLCNAFSGAYEALAGAPAPDDEASPLAPELIEALRQWGRDLAAADLPDDFTPELESGVAAMIKTLAALPDGATGADLTMLEADLSEEESDQAEAVSDYATENCDLS